MNLSEVSKLTEEQARETLERIRWPNGPVCPHCGSVDNLRKLEGQKTYRVGLYKCYGGCGGQFTVTVGSVLDRSHLPIRTWLMAFALLCSSKKGVSALQLQRQLGLGSYRSAWHMAHRIRHAMAQEPLASLLKGAVEVDETYIGGKPRKGSGPARKGRGTKKTPVVALIERNGRARAKPIERVNAATLKGEIPGENVHPESMILTDEWPAYKGFGKEFRWGHYTVNHLQGEYERGGAHVNTAESFFALPKRGLHGSFHHVSKQHLNRYCDEFLFRWDYRKVTDEVCTTKAIERMGGKVLRYKLIVNHSEK